MRGMSQNSCMGLLDDVIHLNMHLKSESFLFKIYYIYNPKGGVGEMWRWVKMVVLWPMALAKLLSHMIVPCPSAPTVPVWPAFTHLQIAQRSSFEKKCSSLIHRVFFSSATSWLKIPAKSYFHVDISSPHLPSVQCYSSWLPGPKVETRCGLIFKELRSGLRCLASILV